MLAELQSALRRELETGELLDLEEDFYDTVQSWLKSLSTRAEEGAAELPDELVERAKMTVKKLFLLRLVKELNYIWTHDCMPEKRLPKQEASVLESILGTINRITGEEAEKHGGMEETIKVTLSPARGLNVVALVFFKKPYSKLMLSNGKLLGPFAAGDIAIVPLSDAAMLANAEIVEVLMSFTV